MTEPISVADSADTSTRPSSSWATVAASTSLVHASAPLDRIASGKRVSAHQSVSQSLGRWESVSPHKSEKVPPPSPEEYFIVNKSPLPPYPSAHPRGTSLLETQTMEEITKQIPPPPYPEDHPSETVAPILQESGESPFRQKKLPPPPSWTYWTPGYGPRRPHPSVKISSPRERSDMISTSSG